MTDDVHQFATCLKHLVKRFMEANVHAKILAMPRQSNDDFENLQISSEVEQSEKLFLVNLSQARNWAVALKEYLPANDATTFSNALDSFIDCCKEAHRLRNFQLHEDEYVFGKGNEQNKFENREPLIPGFQGNGLSTIRIENSTIKLGEAEVEIDALHLIGTNICPVVEIDRALPHFEVLFARWTESNQVTNPSSD